MSKVFAGVDSLIDDALSITDVGTSSPHHRSKEAALRLDSRPASLETPELLRQILRQIKVNLSFPQARWGEMGGSRQNWRWKKNVRFSPRQRADEKTIEKLIARDCGDYWVNQVPTASGLLNNSGEKLCNLDLVYMKGEHRYEFIELKFDDSTPLFAAFEAVKYLLLFLVSREMQNELRYSVEHNPLLWAKRVRSVVLAPPEYYDRYSLRWLQHELGTGLGSLSNAELNLEFGFEQMPWPHDLDVKAALLSRGPVYPE